MTNVYTALPYDCPGNNINQINGVDLPTCISYCNDDGLDCQGVSYSSAAGSTGICIPKTLTCDPFSGDPPPPAPPNDWHFYAKPTAPLTTVAQETFAQQGCMSQALANNLAGISCPPVNYDAFDYLPTEPTLEVVWAAYGTNQVNTGDVGDEQTATLNTACQQQEPGSCIYEVNYEIIGDPSPGNEKSYSVLYNCYSKYMSAFPAFNQQKTIYISPEASGSTLFLNCQNAVIDS